jgi:hypothetical protein
MMRYVSRALRVAVAVPVVLVLGLIVVALLTIGWLSPAHELEDER